VKRRPRYRAVLFDLDGTFADTAPDLAGAVNRMRVDRGLRALPLEQLRPMASHGARGLLQVGFEAAPEDPGYADLRDEFLRNYTEAICVESRVYPGIEALLDALAARRIPWGIVTNKVEVLTRRLLAAMRLAHPPACVVSGDTAARPKPAPDPLLYAAAQLGVAASDCIYLGDDLRDMQAALAAGMGAAAVTYGYGGGSAPRQWGAHYLIDSPEDLVTLDLV
jgi:phosphoglycolate phosphatase